MGITVKHVIESDGKESSMVRAVADGSAHYYASSSTTWKTGTCPMDIISHVYNADRKNVKYRGMAGTSCIVYWVPLPLDAHYDIENYVPVVADMVCIAKIDYAEKLRKYSKRLSK